MRTHTHTYTHHTHAHAHTHIHTHTHTYVHTYIHTHTHSRERVEAIGVLLHTNFYLTLTPPRLHNIPGFDFGVKNIFGVLSSIHTRAVLDLVV